MHLDLARPPLLRHSLLTSNNLDLVLVLVLQRLEVLVLRGQAALGRDVDEDEVLVLVVAELDGAGGGVDLGREHKMVTKHGIEKRRIVFA